MSLEAKLKERYGDDLDDVEDIEELSLDGIISISKISESDKKFLERFNMINILSACGLHLTTVENLPNIPSLQIVRGALITHSSLLAITRSRVI